jgi:pyridoxamine 5'-phosphate oxidase
MPDNKSFSRRSINPNPFIQFDLWYKEHLASGTANADSVSLGTAFADGRVSVRTVLLKEFDEAGFVFFTNYNSKKGSQLSENSRAALLFYWPGSDRQVRIEGVAFKIPENESDSYFRTRPRESQLGAWASEQSSVIPDRQHLEKKYLYYKDSFNNKPVDRPKQWGGYRLSPDWFEFWQAGEFRLHDRLIFTKKNGQWVIDRLAP